jgi:hypothetical protein
MSIYKSFLNNKFISIIKNHVRLYSNLKDDRYDKKDNDFIENLKYHKNNSILGIKLTWKF